MWGKAAYKLCFNSSLGITPTHVGKSPERCFDYAGPEDHPHPCGEKQVKSKETEEGAGSPPPMWGKVISCHHKHQVCRITPTHVGKSTGHVYFFINIRDHPPPMWGKELSNCQPICVLRITPTHVGKSPLTVSADVRL